MKKIFLISSIILMLFGVSYLTYFLFLRSANPKLHKLKVGEEKKITEIYQYDCEKIVFIGGKNKKEKMNLFCNYVEVKKPYEINDVLILFIDEKQNGTAYPLYTYIDDIEREPFYDAIYFSVPFDTELIRDTVYVIRKSSNIFNIEIKETITEW